MAKATLPTNFVDDVMNTSMGGKRRYNLIQNPDGTVSLEDVTSYTQVGSSFGASQVNATNKAVNESVDKAVVIDSLDDINANTQSGRVAGASAVKQLSSRLIKLGYIKWNDFQLGSSSWSNNVTSKSEGICPSGELVSNVFSLPVKISGKYLVIANAIFSSNSNGLRGLRVYVNEIAHSPEEFFPVVNGQDTVARIIRIIDLKDTDTIRLGIYQSSGNDMKITHTWLYIIRIE